MYNQTLQKSFQVANTLMQLKKSIFNFFSNIFYYRRIQTIKKIEKPLLQELLVRREKQKALMIKIKSTIMRESTKRQLSKYIPLSRKSKSEIFALVYFEFGTQMKDLKIHINEDLKFI